ncbi:hypothetical protein GCM10009601_14220 [Streptomyces thermospinosisporus]|uniref:DUF3017 domain-containing protein n=1 Tax=Streptomyces thermospinosisporus TaxID=161482 RepID=A0ABN1YN99_9ACTN
MPADQDTPRTGETPTRTANAPRSEGGARRRADETRTEGGVTQPEGEARSEGEPRAEGDRGREADGKQSQEAPRPEADGKQSRDEPRTGTGGKTAEGETRPEEDGITVRDPVSAPGAEGTPRRTTRRFPLFTRDTARPEGGGRAAPGDAPAPARQWPILAVLLTVGLGLLLTALDAFRWGTLLVGAALVAGAVLRWLVPDVGMLAVRSRFTDILTYGVLGTAIVLLALMMQPDPWLELPFLKDMLHFTVSN